MTSRRSRSHPVEQLLEGILELPKHASGVVAFSHGSGSGRHSPRNRYVAQQLQAEGLGTLLLDLLTPDEDLDYEMRFDIELLTGRLADAVRFLRKHDGNTIVVDRSVRRKHRRGFCTARRGGDAG